MIGASSLTLLPIIKTQSASSIPLIVELNKYCERFEYGILEPS